MKKSQSHFGPSFGFQKHLAIFMLIVGQGNYNIQPQVPHLGCTFSNPFPNRPFGMPKVLRKDIKINALSVIYPTPCEC